MLRFARKVVLGVCGSLVLTAALVLTFACSTPGQRRSFPVDAVVDASSGAGVFVGPHPAVAAAGRELRRARAQDLQRDGLLSPDVYGQAVRKLETMWVRDAARHVVRLLEVLEASPEDAHDPLDVVLPILARESMGRVYAVSSSGAAGLWQLMPEDYVRTCRTLGIEPGAIFADPEYLAAYTEGRGLYYSKKAIGDLSHLFDRYASGGSGDEARRLLGDVERRHRVARELVTEIYDLLPADPRLAGRHAGQWERNEIEIAAAREFFASGCEPSRDMARATQKALHAEFRGELSRQRTQLARAAEIFVAARDRVLAERAGTLAAARQGNLAMAQTLERLDARFGMGADRVALAHLSAKEDVLLHWGIDPANRRDWVAQLMRLYNGGEFNEEGRRLGLHPPMDETEAYVVETLRLGAQLRALVAAETPSRG